MGQRRYQHGKPPDLIATGEAWTYGYDQANHITSIEKRTTDGGTLQERWDFKYDAYGNRAQTALDRNGDGVVDSTQRYAQDGWNPAKPSPVGLENWDVWMDEDGSNALQTRYVRGDVVDQLFARIGADTNAYWTLTDRLWTIRELPSSMVVSGVSHDAVDLLWRWRSQLTGYPCFAAAIAFLNALHRLVPSSTLSTTNPGALIW